MAVVDLPHVVALTDTKESAHALRDAAGTGASLNGVRTGTTKASDVACNYQPAEHVAACAAAAQIAFANQSTHSAVAADRA